MQDNIVAIGLQQPHFKATRVGLIIEGSPSFDEWMKLGVHLKSVAGSILFLLGDWLNYGENAYGEKYSQALETTEYDYQTLANTAYVCSRFETSRRRENLSFAHHAEVASLEGVEQENLLDRSVAEKWNRNTLRKEVKRFKQQKKLIAAIEQTTEVAEGLFDIVVIDPPWDYQDDSPAQSVNPYPSMSVDAIESLEIPLTKNSVVWIWTNIEFLHAAYHVAEDWGLTPVSLLTWETPTAKPGDWLYEQTKHVLMCVKGSPAVTLVESSTILHGKPEELSRKPKEFYKLVEELCIGRKLEMFAREQREGWTTVGSEMNELGGIE
jgi:N6-adenosine-specific RNA methylase IME4